MWLPLTCPLVGTGPATQACSQIGNQTGDPLVQRSVFGMPQNFSNQFICAMRFEKIENCCPRNRTRECKGGASLGTGEL